MTKTANEKVDDLMAVHGLSDAERKLKLGEFRHKERRRYIEFRVRRLLGQASLDGELSNVSEGLIDSEAAGFAATFSNLDEIAEDILSRLANTNTVDLDFVKRALSLGRKPGRWYKENGMKWPVTRRRRYVFGLVWSLCRNDPSLQSDDSASRERLVGQVSRRLRKIERMRYYVSGADDKYERAWRDLNNSEGHWFDHHVMRLFEYPRIEDSPRFRQILGTPPPATPTDAPSWEFRGGKWETKARPSPTASEYWDVTEDETKDFVLNTQGRANPVAAILSFFEAADPEDFTDFPSNHEKGWRQFSSRTWNYCDRVILILHLEEWLYEVFRLAGGSIDSWAEPASPTNTVLKAALADPTKGPDYIRVTLVWDSPDAPFVGSGSDADMGFERVEIRVDELQLGDHLVLWNHPAYSALNEDPWRLENSLIVDFRGTELPQGIIVQGHGTSPVSFGEMQADLIDSFNTSLATAQKKTQEEVAADATVKSFTISSGGQIVQRNELKHEGLAGYWAWWIATDGNLVKTLTGALVDGEPIVVPAHFSEYHVASPVAWKVPVIYEMVYLTDNRIAATGLNLFEDRVLGAYLVRGNFSAQNPTLGPDLTIVPSSFKADGGSIDLDLPADLEPGDWIVMLRAQISVEPSQQPISQIETRASMPLVVPRTVSNPYTPANYYVAFYRLFQPAVGQAVKMPPADSNSVLQFLRYSSPWQTLTVIRPKEVV
jgi:hypothetical protein